jgi:hypothetical protein
MDDTRRVKALSSASKRKLAGACKGRILIAARHERGKGTRAKGLHGGKLERRKTKVDRRSSQSRLESASLLAERWLLRRAFGQWPLMIGGFNGGSPPKSLEF